MRAVALLRWKLRGVVVAGLLLLPGALGAQAPAQRDSLDALRDSLARVADSAALAALETRMIAYAREHREEPMVHLRLGLVALRLGQLGRRDGFDDAAGEFEWATDLAPDWPWGWYGRGLAESGILDSPVSLVAGLQAMFGKDRLARTAANFARAAEVDPSFTRALTDLAATALEQRINIKLELALEALRRGAGTVAGRDTAVLLARGRVEREAGDADSSVAAFRAYLERGGDAALGRLELARSLFVTGSLDGVAPYYEAAAAGAPAADSALRRDLVALAADSDLAALDARHGAARAEWLRAFWERRDVADLRPAGERLREHYRRLWYARRNFRLVSTRRQYRIEERFRSYSKDWDDRGIIYIRHGEPTARATIAINDLPLNQSWRYERPEGDLIFHFVAREDVQDWKLVESLYDILGFDQAVALRSGIATPDQRALLSTLLQSRSGFAPVYDRLLASGGVGTVGLMDRERLAGRRSIATGTTTDSYALRFAGPLPAAQWELLAAGTADGTPMVHFTWAVPGGSLVAVPSTRGPLYPVRVRIAVTALPGGRTAAFVDTTTLFVSGHPVGREEWLVGRVPVPLAPGRYLWHMALQEGEAGARSALDTLVIPDGSALALSDLVLGAPTSGLRWVRAPGDTVWFNPVGALRADVPLQLFYEVLGLRAGEPYRTELRVTKPGGLGFLGRLFGRGASLTVRSEDRAPAGRATLQRALDLTRLAPGTYTLELSVAQGDARVRRRATFRVLPRSP